VKSVKVTIFAQVKRAFRQNRDKSANLMTGIWEAEME
jgi:hypothetical protein